MISQKIRALAPEQDPLRMGMGWTVEDLSKPQIMIESTFGDSHPGSAGGAGNNGRHYACAIGCRTAADRKEPEKCCDDAGGGGGTGKGACGSRSAVGNHDHAGGWRAACGDSTGGTGDSGAEKLVGCDEGTTKNRLLEGIADYHGHFMASQ